MKHVRRGIHGDEGTDIPCAICHEAGNRTLYQCKKCGRWVCEWDCLDSEDDICKECVEKEDAH
jgi:hypothetical protein